MKNIALIVAAGVGVRCGLSLPKQYYLLGNKTILRHTIETFVAHPKIHAVKVVIGQGHEELYSQSTSGLNVLPFTYGGLTRQQSVLNGLRAVKEQNPENILIHDAARPYVTFTLIDKVLKLLERFEAVDMAASIKDTLKFRNNLATDIKRDQLYATQTPQGFRYAKIIEWHSKYQEQSFTDDISLAIQEGVRIGIAEGSSMNFKITTQEDLMLANMLMQDNYHIRSGFGYDVHRIEFTDDITNTIPIAGINIPSNYRVIAHSDGDVAIHAIMDALLGAISAGDIGHHFPPDDDKYKGVDSKELLAQVKGILDKHDAAILNIDCTIVAETPKVRSFVIEMKNILASILSLDQNQISIKATTSEGLGFIGQREGISAYASCSVKVRKV